MADYKTILRPYLIQRGSFRDIKEEDIVGLDSLISYDYMGSSEFEFGALGASLKRITASWDDYASFTIGVKDADGKPLYILCKEKQLKEIEACVQEMVNKAYSDTKEHVGLCEYILCKSEYCIKTNFWWDITSEQWHYVSDKNLGTGNDWMACFGIKNLRKLIIAINKVCMKHERPVKEKVLPEDAPEDVLYQDIRIDDNREKRGAVVVSYPDGSKKVIVKRNIISFNNSDTDKLKVLVQTKAGHQREIEFAMVDSSKRRMLTCMLIDWPAINKKLK